MICFLPFRGEFGWYLCSYVLMINGDSHTDKIVCIKPGHECLFPTVTNFFYNWQDIPDNHKAGVIIMDDEDTIKEMVKLQFPNEEITFISHSIIDWNNRHTFYQHSFVPKHKNNLNIGVDVVITPRFRRIDANRNWKLDNWQLLINELTNAGYTVGVCGTKETSHQLQNVLHKSYDHIDIDSDIEMISKAKLVITQETGLQYLSFMCKRPTFCVGHYHKDHGADLYRDISIPFKEFGKEVDEPLKIAKEAIYFLESQK